MAARRRGKDTDWRRRTVKLLRSLFFDGWTFEDIDFPFEKEYFGTVIMTLLLEQKVP